VNSITFAVSIPFGGRAYNAPAIAASNKAYVAAQVKKAHLYRGLLKQVHEAEHALEVERAILENAQQRQANAHEHLQMANLSFEAGEINLMDFLRIQKRSLQAIKDAQESAIKLQRDIALYNQAVGVMP
jgi:outer membrane protein TolC